VVTVLSVGPERATDAVRKALQMDADKGVHVVDDAIAGSDALGGSLVLAEAIKKLPHDLVVCGMASTDGRMGVVPAMLSEGLGVPGGDARLGDLGGGRQGDDPPRRRCLDRHGRGQPARGAVGD
jgi:electron transfer flavoprotein alpha/beta subunit